MPTVTLRRNIGKPSNLWEIRPYWIERGLRAAIVPMGGKIVDLLNPSIKFTRQGAVSRSVTPFGDAFYNAGTGTNGDRIDASYPTPISMRATTQRHTQLIQFVWVGGNPGTGYEALAQCGGGNTSGNWSFSEDGGYSFGFGYRANGFQNNLTLGVVTNGLITLTGGVDSTLGECFGWMNGVAAATQGGLSLQLGSQDYVVLLNNTSVNRPSNSHFLSLLKFDSRLSDAEAAALQGPMLMRELLRPAVRRIYFDMGAGAAVPTLSALTASQITTSGARHSLTLTF